LRKVLPPHKIPRMSQLTLSVSVLALVLATVGAPWAHAAEPLKEPAKIEVSVSPRPVAPGSTARVVIQLHPVEGVKINRYPKIKLEVPAQAGLVAGDARAEIGNDTPPPPEELEKNYFETVDPLELELNVEASATSGQHEVDARLTYFYCVTKSGYCAPAKIPLKIPVTVR
jgi:hypothetical protein